MSKIRRSENAYEKCVANRSSYRRGEESVIGEESEIVLVSASDHGEEEIRHAKQIKTNFDSEKQGKQSLGIDVIPDRHLHRLPVCWHHRHNRDAVCGPRLHIPDTWKLDK